MPEEKVKMATTVKDVVCGMEVDPQTAEFTSNYNGKKFYFCSAACKEKFDEDPSLFAA